MSELDWEAFKLNLDRLTTEALSDIHDRVQIILLARQAEHLQKSLNKVLEE